jgi:hypothetical protein
MALRDAVRGEIDSALATCGFTCPSNLQDLIASKDAYSFALKSGVVVFVRSDRETFKIVLCLNKGSGAQKKSDIIESFDWMFSNTDATRLLGIIDADNESCLAMVPQTWGYDLVSSGDRKIYTVTRARWANERV